MRWPSGDQRACISNAIECVSGVASPPAMGKRVEIAQQVEHQALAVGADVDAHPGAGAGVDGDRLLGLAGRVVDVPLRLFGRLGVRIGGGVCGGGLEGTAGRR